MRNGGTSEHDRIEVDVGAYLDECRGLTLDEIKRLLPSDGAARPVLYDLILDYPLRDAKALRPALCIAVCRALGGTLAAALPTAAVLELYHNAFLIHDDVEDGSEKRRDEFTLHEAHGVPIAVNVGDALLALTLEPLLDNARLVGLGKALRVLREVGDMARVSVEGQAIELDWVRRGAWSLADDDYIDMVLRKTARYTFVTPLVVGAILGGANDEERARLARFGECIGVAFQITDDLLNLSDDETGYGKERAGDLWEGKRTLMLLHALRHASDDERRRALDMLSRPRPSLSRNAALTALVDELHRAGELSATARARLHASCGETVPVKREEDIDFLLALIERTGAYAHARAVCARWTGEAERAFAAVAPRLNQSTHTSFLHRLIHFVVERTR